MTGQKRFDRKLLLQKPLVERKNKVTVADIYVKTTDPVPDMDSATSDAVHRVAGYILDARKTGNSVMLAFGAHSIKNGLGHLMVEFIKKGWITHFATNGAGIIHDWEFAFIGKSSESVAENLPKGEFGTWNETGLYLNLAIIAGAYEGLGYGASVGKAIIEEGIMIPSREELLRVVRGNPAKASSAADFIEAIERSGVKAGWLSIPAPFREFSLQAGAYRYGVHSTDHPMFGHDIIYTHVANSGSAIGRTAQTDFETFVESYKGLDGGGVYLSLGSAVMSPSVFEIAGRKAGPVSGHHIAVIDLGEVAKIGKFEDSHPETLDFIKGDNRKFLLALYKELSRMENC
ncbi:MAG: hypothetical protein MJY56_00210 [Bacteroidales bacterium]|nr:hypothetical protein [Bacteroidales bacterium]